MKAIHESIGLDLLLDIFAEDMDALITKDWDTEELFLSKSNNFRLSCFVTSYRLSGLCVDGA